jgi:exodeoxyribonuclease VII small subunit
MTKKSFEDALDKLEQITKDLEEGDLSLEESLKHFDEGIKLAEYCNHKLSDAQKKVEILLKKDDTLTSVEFDGIEEDQ